MWSKVKNVHKAVKKDSGKEGKEVKKTGKKKSEKADVKKSQNEKKEEVPEVDPQEAFRQLVYEAIKTCFELVTVNDKIDINVDNIYPLMKTLELDAKDEPILDMIRTSCIETYGNIDELEWDQAVLEQRRRVTGEEFEEDIRSAFGLIDKDADGIITNQDIYQLMMGLGEMLTDEEITEIIKAADMDKDGQINYRDFKYFLIGELDEPEEDKKEPPVDEASTEEKKETAEEPPTTEEPPAAGEEKKDETKENEENKPEEKPVVTESQEEIEKRKLQKRKSLLWGYNIPKKVEEKKVEEKKVEEKKVEEKTVEEPVKTTEEDVKPAEPKKRETHDSGIGSESESEVGQNKTEETEEDSRGIISVTVKHLDSIVEQDEADEDEDVFEEQSSKKRTPTPTSRPVSAATSIKSMTEDTGIIDDDSEDVPNEFDDFDETFTLSRTSSARMSSARNRLSSAKSRVSSRVSSAKSVLGDIHENNSFAGKSETDITELGISMDMDSMALSEDEPPIRNNEFTQPMSDRQINYYQNFDERHGYCEIGTTEDLDNDVSVTQYSAYEKAPFFIKTNRGFPRRPLQRCKSASRIQTIRKLEHTILLRQSTEPKLNLEAIRKANEISKSDTVKRNANGLVCSHINMKLLVKSEPSENYESYSRTLTRRPRTAPVLSTRRQQLIRKNSLSSDSDEENNFVSIIDLSQSLSKDTAGYPENPDLPLKHSGYKSVWPLARVKSARNSKINNGKNIEFNSVSRRLEKIQVPFTRSESSFVYDQKQQSLRNSFNTRSRGQSVINLEVPYCKPREIKRASSLSMMPIKPLRG